jgi:peptide/nickel transport system permease protein
VRRARASACVLAALLLVAVLAPLIAGRRPIVAGRDGAVLFPVFSSARWDGRADWALLPPVPFDPDGIDVAARKRTPDRVHWLGTDDVGRDVLSRLVHGTRAAMLVGFAAVAIQLLLGIAVGWLAGTLGRWVDAAAMRVIEGAMCFPPLVLALLLVAFFGPGLVTVVLALGLTGWTAPARLLRAELLRLRSQDHVAAARSLGIGGVRLFLRHLLPHAAPPLLVFAAFGVAAAILTESSLSFLGLGVESTTPTWGSVASQGRAYAGQGLWHLVVFPGFLVFVCVMSLNRIGEALRER